MRKLLPVLLPVVLTLLGLGGGVGAGLALRPEPVDVPPAELSESAPANLDTVRLPNQFIVPLVADGRVQAVVVLGLALDLTTGHGLSIHAIEPKLRSIFLQVMFDFAGSGGFSGQFTSAEHLLPLRRQMTEAGRAELGPVLHDVLITELVRQDT